MDSGSSPVGLQRLLVVTGGFRKLSHLSAPLVTVHQVACDGLQDRLAFWVSPNMVPEHFSVESDQGGDVIGISGSAVAICQTPREIGYNKVASWMRDRKASQRVSFEAYRLSEIAQISGSVILVFEAAREGLKYGFARGMWW